jgi:hypothetical protein
MDKQSLGRLYVADDRDWTADKLHVHLAAASPFDPTQTIEEASASLVSWRDVLAFASALWAWLRHKKPSPTPTPGGVPAWDDPIVLDQGQYGTCVGNGWAGWGDSAPIQDNFQEKDARAIYYEATVIDGSPDNPDAPGGGQQGSTVRSGAKAMQNRGLLTAYAFSQKLADVDEWINNHGPVVFGSDWTNDMFNPDHNGFIVPTGGVAGGHCYLLLDKLDDGSGYLFRNSWGTGWGLSGNFKMTADSVQKLLTGIDSPGEACMAAEVAH